MQERRRFHRTRTFTAATLTGRDGCAIEGVIRDLSTDGALLLVDDPGLVPGDLTLDRGDRGDRRDARVAWRGKTGVGLVFVAARHNVIAFPLPARSASPEADRERLARRIARFVRPRDPGSR